MGEENLGEERESLSAINSEEGTVFQKLFKYVAFFFIIFNSVVKWYVGYPLLAFREPGCYVTSVHGWWVYCLALMNVKNPFRIPQTQDLTLVYLKTESIVFAQI